MPRQARCCRRSRTGDTPPSEHRRSQARASSHGTIAAVAPYETPTPAQGRRSRPGCDEGRDRHKRPRRSLGDGICRDVLGCRLPRKSGVGYFIEPLSRNQLFVHVCRQALVRRQANCCSIITALLRSHGQLSKHNGFVRI